VNSMFENRLGAGLVGAAGVVALLTGSAAVAGAAPVDTQATVTLTPGPGIPDLGGELWYVHGGRFKVTIKATTGSDGGPQGYLIVSIPDELRLIGFEGDGWYCEDEADDDAEFDCLIEEPRGPGESWPDLTVEVKAQTTVIDTFDVYLQGDGTESAHAGHAFNYDTSG